MHKCNGGAATIDKIRKFERSCIRASLVTNPYTTYPTSPESTTLLCNVPETTVPTNRPLYLQPARNSRKI